MIVDRVGLGAVFARGRAPVLFALLVFGGALLLRHDVASPNQPHKSALNPLQVQTAFGHLPMSFEPNRGQSNDQVKFQARGNGYALYLAKSEAVLAFPADSRGNPDSTKPGSLLEMQLVGGNLNAGISGVEPLPGHSNYFIGNDPSRWRRNIPQFARVQYRDVYPGVDLAFYGKQNRLEYDFDVAPGSDPRQIELTFKGAKSMTLAENGDLVLAMDGRELRFEAPHIYQASGAGTQKTIGGSFVLRGNSSAGFEVGEYDHTRTLVVDPVLAFSTYLGGSGDESCSTITGAAFVPHCPAIAVDSASRAYVAGATTSSGGSFGGTTAPSLTGGADVFLARLDSNGSALDYVTYLGGSGAEYPAGVGVDSGFNVYVAGTTNSANFPVTATAFQSTAGSVGNHVFVAKLDSSGSANLYSTYLSGTGIDTASGFAVDILGRAYVIGTTTSPNFPTTGGALQPTPAATNQFFFSKVDPAASGTNSLLYSTYIGGSTPSNGAVMGGAVAVDSSFNVYLAGGTTFTDMPVVNAYQSALKGAGTSDVWAARLNAPANNTQQYIPLYETYLGGSGNDVGYGVASDGTSAYITGSTSSSDITLPTATTAFQSTNKGGIDAFVAKFGTPVTTGTTQGSVPLSYFTYLGGGSTDTGLAIVADSSQNARVTGFTDSSDFPVAIGPIQGSSGGGRDAFFARILTSTTSTTTNTSSSTFLGGSGTDVGTSVALDSSLNDYVAGETKSGNFPLASPLQPSLSGPSDAFVSKLGPSTSGLSMPAVTPANALPAGNAANPAVSPSPTGVGSQVTFTYYIYNTTDPVSGVVFTDTLGANSGAASAAASPGTCASSANGTIVCSLGTVPTSTTTTSGTTTTLNFAAKVVVTVTAATSVLSGSFSLGNSAALSFPGSTLPSISGTATVNDFAITASPASATVTSGASAVYVVKVTPTGAGFPGSVSFSCGSGLPSGASCSFINNPVPNMNNGPQSRSMQIATIARVTTPAALFRERKLFYAFWLPISGLAVIGTGISRKRRVLLGVFFSMVVGMVLLQAGCGSSKSSTTTTTGTPAGTYTVTVNATSGSATRTTTVQLTVK